MLMWIVDALYAFVFAVEGLIPLMAPCCLPDVMPAADAINVVGTVLLPLEQVKNALLLVVAVWIMRLAVVPVRWLLIAVRGVNPG